MNGFLYGIALQWKMDIRSKSLLVTCYIVPLIFFLLMGGIFTSVMPEMRSTLIQSMIVMNVSMGAFIGLPPSLTETYGSGRGHLVSERVAERGKFCIEDIVLAAQAFWKDPFYLLADRAHVYLPTGDAVFH